MLVGDIGRCRRVRRCQRTAARATDAVQAARRRGSATAGLGAPRRAARTVASGSTIDSPGTDADMPLPPTAAAQALVSLWLLSSVAAGTVGSEASASYVADAPAFCPANPAAAETAKAGTPNLVLILTDDMDLALGGFTPLKKTAKLLSQRGATASNYFIRALASQRLTHTGRLTFCQHASWHADSAKPGKAEQWPTPHPYVAQTRRYAVHRDANC